MTQAAVVRVYNLNHDCFEVHRRTFSSAPDKLKWLALLHFTQKDLVEHPGPFTTDYFISPEFFSQVPA